VIAKATRPVVGAVAARSSAPRRHGHRVAADAPRRPVAAIAMSQPALRKRRVVYANESSPGRPRADGVGAATVTRTGRSCSAHTSRGPRRRRRLFGGRVLRRPAAQQPRELSCRRSPPPYDAAPRAWLSPVRGDRRAARAPARDAAVRRAGEPARRDRPAPRSRPANSPRERRRPGPAPRGCGALRLAEVARVAIGADLDVEGCRRLVGIGDASEARGLAGLRAGGGGGLRRRARSP